MNLPFIINDKYTTPEKTGRYWLDRVFPKYSLVFYYHFLRIVLSQRRAALKGSYDDEAWARGSLNVMRLIEKCGGRFHITGLENLRKCKGPVVIVSNHMSTLETMVFPFLIAPAMRVTFVVKESIMQNKIFGPIMRARNPITVGRTNSREDLIKVLDQGKKLLENGISLVIFPQSTRQVDFKPEKFNSLGTKLASKSGVQVLPVAIQTDFWGNGKRIKELGPINRSFPIHMNFGSPMDVGASGKEAHLAVVNHIQENLKTWGKERESNLL